MKLKKYILLIFFILGLNTAFCQLVKPYHPEANAEKEINDILKKAKSEGKFVLIQAGGNWCSWCLEFNRLTIENEQIDSALNKNYIFYHLNYSKENLNLPIFKKYGYPQRFGFPVFIVLNEEGKAIHIQNSEYLEDGKKSYDVKKVLAFFKNWSPAAFDPKNYVK